MKKVCEEEDKSKGTSSTWESNFCNYVEIGLYGCMCVCVLYVFFLISSSYLSQINNNIGGFQCHAIQSRSK